MLDLISNPFVVAQLSQLTQPLSLLHTRGRPPADAVPALLVIPRGGPIDAPHLMVIRYDKAPGDAHIVAEVDDVRARGMRSLADVLLTRPARLPSAAAARVTVTLDRYVGCAVAVTRNRGGCLMGLRDGNLAEVMGIGGFAADSDPWPAVLGSFLYAWQVARIPLPALASAVVIAGYCPREADQDGRCELWVAGRVTIEVRPNIWTQQVRDREAS